MYKQDPIPSPSHPNTHHDTLPDHTNSHFVIYTKTSP
jgi:hypothetical protein